jgi:hypothetical protein
MRPVIRRAAAVTFLAAFLACHLLSLRTPAYSTPDEAAMGSMTLSFIRTGHLKFDVAPFWTDVAPLAYGPIYFAVLAPVLRVLGVGVVQNRLLAALAGFALMAIIWAILRARELPERTAIVIGLAFALDPILTQAMHFGRMDTLAMCFVFGALLLLLEPSRARRGGRVSRSRLLAAGVLAGLAILTTPRAALAAAPLAIVVPDWRGGRVREWLIDLVLLGAPVTALYGIWMLSAFGGPLGTLHYYSGLSTFATPRFYVPRVQVPLICAAAAAAVWAALRKRRLFATAVMSAAFIGILLFYGFVHQVSGVNSGGGYSIYVVPFFYVLIAEALRHERFGWTAAPALLLVVANVVFAVHYATTYIGNDRPDGARPLERFLAGVIPSGSRVVGDEVLYFSALRTGEQYQHMNTLATDEERERYQRLVYDYEYVLWSDRLASERQDLLRLYQGHSTLEPIARYDDPFVLEPFWRRIGVPAFYSLGVTVYRRTDANSHRDPF